MEENYRDLTCTFLHCFLKDRKDRNLVFSPLSILVLLAMAGDAVRGAAREEIVKVLGAGAPDADVSFEEIKTRIAELQSGFTAGGSLLSSNAVCVRESIRGSIAPDYERRLAEAFGGRLFASRDIVRDVNAWVKEQTRGMVKDIADESMSHMLACLMNAVAFEAGWLEQYEEGSISEGVFTNADRTQSRVQMLHSAEHSYIEDDDFTGFMKPYRDSGFAFLALLPKKRGRAALRRAAAKIDFAKLAEGAVYDRVLTAMPEFTCDFEENLTELCKQLGIRTLFTPEADFSPMSSEQLAVDAIIHKAHIEVDRKGTKAAAATAAFVVKGAAAPREQKYVCLDRPFVYAVVNTETGLPAFAGVCSQMGE